MFHSGNMISREVWEVFSSTVLLLVSCMFKAMLIYGWPLRTGRCRQSYSLPLCDFGSDVFFPSRASCDCHVVSLWWSVS